MPRYRWAAWACAAIALGSLWAAPAQAASDAQVRGWAQAAAKECAAALEAAIRSGELKPNDVFDTFYVPILDMDPPKFHTRYDDYVDRVIGPIQERYLGLDKGLVFVILVDKNGYLPSHNKKFSQPLTGDKAKDAVGNRTKRIFNDRTGIRAARNLEPVLLQTYKRDSGEEMKDLSVPVTVQGRHWGAVRFAYR